MEVVKNSMKCCTPDSKTLHCKHCDTQKELQCSRASAEAIEETDEEYGAYNEDSKGDNGSHTAAKGDAVIPTSSLSPTGLRRVTVVKALTLCV